MADEEETPVREWEVVSLTASNYAASPGPEKNEMTDGETSDSVGVDGAKTSDPLFKSGHFVLPQDQPENKEIQSIHESEYAVETGDFGCQSIADERLKSEMKGQDEINIEGLDMSENISGIQFTEKGKLLSVGAAEFNEGDGLSGLSLVDKEQSIYSCAGAELGSLCSESIMSETTAIEESSVIAEVTELRNLGYDSSISDPQNPENEDFDACDLPCGAWWKRKAVSIYAYAKEANTFWSVFVAAAVMGLVILGQRWQQENWQILQLKWQSSISNEKMGRMFGPLTRLKDVLVGGHRQTSFIKGSSSMDH